MTMTDEALTMIELDAAIAPAPMLSHYIDVVRNGVRDAPADVAEHGRHLLLKLEHLRRQQQIESIPAAATRTTWLRGSRSQNRCGRRPEALAANRAGG